MKEDFNFEDVENMEYPEKRKLQKVILIVTEEIKRICEKNNIKYSMDSGSMLGAIRHKGFIPWDDDFDFSMMREEYEKFIKACEVDLDTSKFFLQTGVTEEKYAFEFAKIQLKDTEIIEDFSKNVDIHHGIFVDIFPVDMLPEGNFKRKIFKLKNHILKNMVWVKCGYGTPEHFKKVSYKVLRIIVAPFSINQIKKMRHMFITSHNNRRSIDKRCFISDYPRSFRTYDLWDELVMYPFENSSYLGFKDYNRYLSNLYGDYMTLPPTEKRLIHSDYTVNYGIYKNIN